jgi:hypothetical protein
MADGDSPSLVVNRNLNLNTTSRKQVYLGFMRKKDQKFMKLQLIIENQKAQS